MLTQAWGFCKIEITMWEASKGVGGGAGPGDSSSVLGQSPGSSRGEL